MKKKLTKKLITAILVEEISWCIKNPQNMPEDWQKGFISGLKQSIRLIKEIK